MADQAGLTIAHTAPSISNASSTLALAANASRKWAKFINDGANIIYLNLGGTATANNGIRLAASGGEFTIRADEAGGKIFQGVVNGIALTAATTLLVSEGV